MSDITRAVQALGPYIGTWLPDDEEQRFRDWLAQYGAIDPDQARQDEIYDYRGAFKAGASPSDGHWPSEFKLARHPDLVVGGFDTRTGEPVVPYRQESNVDALVGKGWDRLTAEELIAKLRGGL